MQTAADVVANIIVRYDGSQVVAGTQETGDALKGLSVDAQSLNASTTESALASQSLGNAGVVAATKTRALSVETKAAKLSAQDLVLGLDSATGSVSKAGAAALLTTSNFALLGAAVGVVALKSFADFQLETQQLGGNTGSSGKQVQYLTGQILDLGRNGAGSLNDLSVAFRHASDESYRYAAGQELVKAAQEGVIATGGNVADITNSEAVAMHDWHDPASMAITDLGKLLVAAQQGNETLPELVSHMGRVGAVAAGIHMPMADLVSLLSEFTKATGNPALAETWANALITHIVSPTGVARKEMALLQQQTGVDLPKAFQEFSNGSISFLTLMQDVHAATQGNVQAIETLFGGIRGGAGAVQLLTGGLNDYQVTLTKTSQGTKQLTEQASAGADTLAHKWNVAVGVAHEGLIGLGQAINGVFDNPADLGTLKDQVTATIAPVSDLAKSFFGVVNPATQVNGSLDEQKKKLEALVAEYPHAASYAFQLQTVLAEEAKQHIAAAAAAQKHASALQAINTEKYYSAGGGNNTQAAAALPTPLTGSQVQTNFDVSKAALLNALLEKFSDQAAGLTGAFKVDQEAVDKARATYVSNASVVDKANASLNQLDSTLKTSRQPYDALTVAQNQLSTEQRVAANEFFKTGSILPATQKKLSETNSEIDKFNKVLGGTKPPTDALTAAQQKLQLATAAAYADFDKYGHILPQHQAEIVTDTNKLNAMQLAVSSLTSTLKDDAYQAKLATAQKKEAAAADALALYNATGKGNGPALQQSYDSAKATVDGLTVAMAKATGQFDPYQTRLDAANKRLTAAQEAEALTVANGGKVTQAEADAVSRAKSQVDSLTNAMASAQGQFDPWAVKMQAQQQAVTEATDKYLWDKNVLDLHGQALQADLKRIDDETAAYGRMTKAQDAATWSLTQLANAAHPQHLGSADLPGLHQNQSLAGGGPQGTPPPATPQDNAKWWDAVFKTLTRGGPQLSGFGQPGGSGGVTLGGTHFGVPTAGQLDTLNQSQTQAGYSAREQAEQAIIDSLKHQSVIVGQDTSLTADQRKIDQDILQVKIDRKQTQIDLAKLEALQKDPNATAAQLAAARETVTTDRGKTSEDTGQLSADKTQAGIDTANAIVTASQNEISNANAISQAEIQVSTDVGGLQVQKLAAVVTAIQDGTAFIQANSALDTAKSTAATTSITDQTAIMAATYKLTADGIAGQRTIDQDLRNGDMQQMALDSKIAADQRAVDRAGIALAQATAARDAETSAEQIAIAQDGVTAARHKIDADTAADANQATLLQDGIAIDRARLTLAGDEVDLQKLQATIANDTLSVLHGQTDYSKQIADVTGKIADDNGIIRQLTEKQASDQTAANVSAASYANQQTSDARQQAIDQASLAMSQGNWGKALAILSQQQETANENLSTDQGSLSQLTAMRQMASESLQLAQVGIDGQKAGLDHQKAMISLDQSLSDSQKTAAEDALQVQEDNLAVQDARLKLQEVQDSGGTLVDIAQANLAVNQAGYTLQEDQYKQGQDAITAINNGNNVAALQALVKALQGLLRQQNLPIATSRRGGSTLRYGYGLTAASAGANRGTR